tara:strand:- start:203 stop:595 length:393 start_codon:yes stop_codon:yes gene_type:complete
MSENFKIEIIRPDKTILKAETNQVTIPAYEGLMTILKDHISLVTFLRPGFLEVSINNQIEYFYVEEGTVEFNKNTLLVLSSTVKNKQDFTGEEVMKILEDTKKSKDNSQLSDKDKYKLSYKIEALEEINR